MAPRDRSRIVRLLELDDLGELEPPSGPNQLWTAETRHPTRLVGLVMDREALYARIDARVDAMVAAGAAREVRAAHAAGASETARKALGFDELLAGDVEAMKRRTRNFARRQLTWMRKLAGVEVVDVTGREARDVAAELAAATRPSRARSLTTKEREPAHWRGGICQRASNERLRSHLRGGGRGRGSPRRRAGRPAPAT